MMTARAAPYLKMQKTGMLALKNQSRPCFNSVNNIVDVVTFPYHQSQTAHTDVFVLGVTNQKRVQSILH